MKIFPAIDLYGGQAVRLFQGDYGQMTVYSPDPMSVVRDFAALGARQVHLVDLEGAKTGLTPNLETVERIVREGGLFTELGGGIRSMEIAEKYLSIGVDRVILGTAAVTDEGFLKEALAAFGARVAVGVDLRDGFVSIRGWTEQSTREGRGFFARLQELGVRTVICTDISRDGAMGGANRTLYRELSESFSMDLIASGGVSTVDDIRALSALGLYGAIVGKAYYTGAIDLREAMEAAE